MDVKAHGEQTFRFVAASGGAPQVTETSGFNMLTAELEAFAVSIEGACAALTLAFAMNLDSAVLVNEGTPQPPCQI